MKITILTGAGVSAESGLGTFRDKGGVWTKYDLQEVATPQGFARDPEKVIDFYNMRRKNARGAKPNAAHFALARLQAEFRGEVELITQNVDSLHEAAGSTALHMHGAHGRARCMSCHAKWDAPLVMAVDDPCPTCGEATTRPDVVWFGETPHYLPEIATHLASADLFVAIGTSGTVYPAAGFVAEARGRGARTLEINLEPSNFADLFDDVILGPASETVPQWVDTLL
ncbi:MAG: NAD-dependent deacylase [Paracoccaceae bacterium]|nr:NAD-dependent deacylase [Paracoccaceae bacterium]